MLGCGDCEGYGDLEVFERLNAHRVRFWDVLSRRHGRTGINARSALQHQGTDAALQLLISCADTDVAVAGEIGILVVRIFRIFDEFPLYQHTVDA